MADPAGGRLDPKNWPGLDPHEGEVAISHEDARTIAKKLQADLDRYLNADEGTPDDIKKRGQITDPRIFAGGPDDKSGYPAGRTLAKYLTNAHTELPQAYDEFIKAYQALITSLKKQTGIYKDADDNSSKGDDHDVVPRTDM